MQAARPLSAAAVLRAMRRDILPLVAAEVGHWQAVAASLPDAWTRAVALDSLRAKRFHCEGGAVLALCVPPPQRSRLVRAIVAVQTLSDFLDSWTDRLPGGGAWPAGRVLACHRVFVRAVVGLGGADPAGAADDLAGSARVYADALATEARLALAALPGLDRARPRLLALAMAYSAMQAMKHGESDAREAALAAWRERRHSLGRRPDALAWPEFGAAAGSTLAMFRLYAWAANPGESATCRPAEAAYSPWATALHILLDALVDGREDAQSGDLNWVACMGDAAAAVARLRLVVGEARRRLASDPLGRVLVEGLVATYLADPKARHLRLSWRLALWRAGGPRSWLFGLVARAWLGRGVLAGRPPQLGGEPAPSPRRRPAALRLRP